MGNEKKAYAVLIKIVNNGCFIILNAVLICAVAILAALYFEVEITTGGTGYIELTYGSHYLTLPFVGYLYDGLKDIANEILKDTEALKNSAIVGAIFAACGIFTSAVYPCKNEPDNFGSTWWAESE